MKFILLGSFLLTVFLIVFLIFNLRQDSMTVIQSRLKRLQTALIQQYYELKGDMDWKHWSRELAQRREEIREEVKHGLPRAAVTGKKAADLDTLIDHSWDELITAIGGRPTAAAAATAPTAAAAAPTAAAPIADAPAAAEEQEELEELEEVSEAEEVLEAEETELLEELEAVEEIPEADDDVEVLEEADDTTGETIITPEAFIAEDAGGLEAELEPLDEAPEAELEPVDDVAELEPIDEPDDAPTGDPANAPESARDAALAAEGETMGGGDASPINLAELASQIEFGTVGETATDDGEAPAVDLDVSSPFDVLSFETPSFSPDDDAAATAGGQDAAGHEDIAPIGGEDANAANAAAGKKKQQIELARNNSGLLEITEEGGLPFIYQPFTFQGNSKPQILRPIDEPDGEPIHEQNGVHLIDNEVLVNPQENAQKLDPKFLNLVESILNKDKEE
jgi:hypothetical protein